MHSARSPRTRQVAYQIDLHLVGILKLIDHDHLKAALVCSTDGRVIAQGLVGHTQQVVIIEGGLGSLQCAILGLDGTGQPTSASSAGPPQASTILINASAASALSSSTCSLGNAFARARHGARHHESRRILHGFATRLKRVDGIERRLCLSVAALLAPSAAR